MTYYGFDPPDVPLPSVPSIWHFPLCQMTMIGTKPLLSKDLMAADAIAIDWDDHDHKVI